MFWGEEELREREGRDGAVGGGKREMKGKESAHKFSPGQTNKNALIPRLACSIFCHECEPAFVS